MPPHDPILGNLLLFATLGFVGGAGFAVGRRPTGEFSPIWDVGGRTFAGGAAGIFGGFMALHLYPTDSTYHIMFSLAAGFIGPFTIFDLLKDPVVKAITSMSNKNPPGNGDSKP